MTCKKASCPALYQSQSVQVTYLIRAVDEGVSHAAVVNAELENAVNVRQREAGLMMAVAVLVVVDLEQRISQKSSFSQ